MSEEVMAKQAAAVVPVKSKLQVTMETVNGALKTYAEMMAPNRATTEEEGVEQQKSMLRHIKMVLRLDGQDFVQGWDALLKWVYENRNGCMSMRYRNRWQDKLITVPVLDRNFLERVLHMMHGTADPRSRHAVISRFDWQRLHRCMNDDMQVEKIKGYYSQFGY